MRLIAIGLAGHDPELVADRCWQAGAAGLWEVDSTTLRIGVDDEDADAFLGALADLTPVDVTAAEAVELASRDAVVEVSGHRIRLRVPPTVFGDGHHPTTAACLALLPDLVTPGARVLDVGCGAGALSIGSALLGGRVTAIDIDPVAVQATTDNATANDVTVDVSLTALTEIRGPADVVLANLTAGRLEPLLADIVRLTVPGGSVVLSGMLEEHWTRVSAAIGGQVRDVTTVDGWVTAVVCPTPREL